MIPSQGACASVNQLVQRCSAEQLVMLQHGSGLHCNSALFPSPVFGRACSQIIPQYQEPGPLLKQLLCLQGFGHCRGHPARVCTAAWKLCCPDNLARWLQSGDAGSPACHLLWQHSFWPSDDKVHDQRPCIIVSRGLRKPYCIVRGNYDGRCLLTLPELMAV